MNSKVEKIKKTNEDVVKRLLLSVGIKTFIKNFYDFLEASGDKERVNLIELFKNNNEKWNYSASNTKANIGKRIFIQDLELDALYYIIYQANVNMIGMETKETAIKILNEYTKKDEL